MPHAGVWLMASLSAPLVGSALTLPGWRSRSILLAVSAELLQQLTPFPLLHSVGLASSAQILSKLERERALPDAAAPFSMLGMYQS